MIRDNSGKTIYEFYPYVVMRDDIDVSELLFDPFPFAVIDEYYNNELSYTACCHYKYGNIVEVGNFFHKFLVKKKYRNIKLLIITPLTLTNNNRPSLKICFKNMEDATLTKLLYT